MASDEPIWPNVIGCDLIAASWLLEGQRPALHPGPSPYPLIQRIQAASHAGFRGIGLNHGDLMDNVRAHGHDGIRAMMEQYGISILELELPYEWWVADETGTVWRQAFDDMLETASRIPVRQIKTTGSFTASPPPIDAMAAAFTTVAQWAHQAGTVLGLEIVSFSNVQDIPSAKAIVGNAFGSGGGIMLDCWHFARRGIPAQSIEQLSGPEISGIELSNIGEHIIGSLFEDTLDHRLLPDRGAYDVILFLKTALAVGYRGPIGCEVLSAKIRSLPLLDGLEHCAHAMQSVCLSAGATILSNPAQI
jgi:sugar phosphate isomerase/epimerase